MAKERPIKVSELPLKSDTPENAPETAQPASPLKSLDFLFEIRPALNVEAVITQILDNDIDALEALRAELERSNNRAIPDVRYHGNTAASVVLRGVEDTVTYSDLVLLINRLKAGVARRRVSLEEAA